MSYDLNIWTTTALGENSPLIAKYRLRQTESGLLYDSGTWQITATPALAVEAEDIPDEVQCQLPGISYQIQMNLEPISAPKKGNELLHRLARDIAKEYNGVIEDPQDVSFLLPRGVKKRIPAAADGRVSVVELQWYSINHRLQQREGLADLVGCLAVLLPEALPSRYGFCEPPQEKYESDEQFVRFLYDNRDDMVVWFPKRPVVGVNMSLIAEADDWNRVGQFFCNTFSMTILYSVLSDANWQLQIKRVWKALTSVLRPFYGEVRVLDGYSYSRGRLCLDMQTQQGPTQSGFWKGVPRHLGAAIVLDDLYFDLWKQLTRNEVYSAGDGHHFLSVPDWSHREDLSNYVGKPPWRIRQRRVPGYASTLGGYSHVYNKQYPWVFPFKWSR